MLGEILYWLVNMSIAASVTGICILLLRKVKRIPRYIIFILWAIPFLRMWIPVGLGSKYSLMTIISELAERTVTVYPPESGFQITMMNYMAAANSYFPVVYKENILKDIFAAASIIWIIVTAILLIAFAAMYISSIKELKCSVHMRDNIYLSDKINYPVVFGILRPKILLPAEYKSKELFFILLHESMHIRKADNLWRILALLTVCIHWFNPLAWVFFKCFITDIELSCDEKVLTKCGEEHKKAYAHSLVDFAENKAVFASAFGGAKIRTRIDNILSYERISTVSAVCFGILVVAVAYTLLTNSV